MREMWLAAVAAALGAGGCHHAEKAAPDAVQGAPRATEAPAASIAASSAPEPSAAPSASVVASASATPSASAVKPAPTAPDLAVLAALGGSDSGVGLGSGSCGGLAVRSNRNICGLARLPQSNNQSCGASSSVTRTAPKATIALASAGPESSQRRPNPRDGIASPAQLRRPSPPERSHRAGQGRLRGRR